MLEVEQPRRAAPVRPTRRTPSGRSSRARGARDRSAASDPGSAVQRRVADEQLRVCLHPQGTISAFGSRIGSGRRRSHSPGSPRPSAPARTGDASRAGSSRPRPPTRRRDEAGSVAGRHCARTRWTGSARCRARRRAACGELRRHARDLLHVRLEAVEDRRHVDIRDAPEPHRCLRRTTHVTAAARMSAPQRTIAGVDTS